MGQSCCCINGGSIIEALLYFQMKIVYLSIVKLDLINDDCVIFLEELSYRGRL
jgi:hypothetical protein